MFYNNISCVRRQNSSCGYTSKIYNANNILPHTFQLTVGTVKIECGGSNIESVPGEIISSAIISSTN